MTSSVLVGLALVVAAPATKETPAKDPPTLVGEWAGATGLRGGKPDNPPPGTTLTFTADGKLLMKEGGDSKAEEGTYSADPKKAPAELDITPGGTEKAPTIRGIYKVEGDTLTICLAIGGERPTEFASPPGSENMLVTLKRAKKE
jgi:uncharacterized protein (TIGR03067 family)